MLSINAAQNFSISYARCMENPEFMDRFYDSFISSHEEVREKFKNTDMEKQKKMLIASLMYVMLASTNNTAALIKLREIAKTHGKGGHNIAPHLFELWKECMLEAVKETDPEFNANIRSAWDEVLSFGITEVLSNMDSKTT